MKKVMSFLAVVLMLACMTGYALAHCGTCGISDGYVCAKDNVASKDAGACSVCGGDLAKGDVKEVTDAEGNVTLEPSPAGAHG